MNYLTALLTHFLAFLIGWLPFRLLYWLSDFLRFVLYRVVGYRRQVVEDNLRRCFPEKSEEEIQRLIKGSYKNLADVMVESFKGFTMSDRQIMERHKVVNPDLMNGLLKEGRSVILTPCHYGNWEWGALSASLYLVSEAVVLYKPLSNEYANRLMLRNRSRTGGTLVSIKETAKAFAARKNKACGYVMASDQSPSNPERSIWVDFLGRKTAFLHGIEMYSRKYNIPVLFVDIQRRKRGFYELECSVLAENPKELPPGEVTARYAKALEEVIRLKPENWLWSHKRWKLKPPENNSRTE